MEERHLHGTSFKTIGKKKKLPPEAVQYLKEVKEWEDKVQALQKAKRYREKGEEEELEQLIVYWRSVAQEVARSLLQYFHREDPFDGWGYEDNIAKDQEEEHELKDDDQEQELGRMLSRLRIDPDLIHYCPETDDFND